MLHSDLSFAKTVSAEIQLPPDIAEQNGLSAKMSGFLDAARNEKIKPTERSRSFKDIRINQPMGRVGISFMSLEHRDGRLRAEFHAVQNKNMQAEDYYLYPDGQHWLKVDRLPLRDDFPMNLTHVDMVDEMIEYTGADGHMDALLDTVEIAPNLIISALGHDLGRKAHTRFGHDTYKTVIVQSDGDSYVNARHVELTESRKNGLITRRLALSALVNVAEGPVDITQIIAYSETRDPKGRILRGTFSTRLETNDGMSEKQLMIMAKGSDPVVDGTYVQSVHAGLQHVSREFFL